MSGPVSIEALNVDSAVRAQGMMRQRAGIQMFGLEQTVRLPCTTTGCRSMALLMPQNHHRASSAIPSTRGFPRTARGSRSEEHTSELQSLMRSSYAVVCWTKKKNQQQKKHETTIT